MPIEVSIPSGPSPDTSERGGALVTDTRCGGPLFVEESTLFKQELSHLLGALLKSAP